MTQKSQAQKIVDKMFEKDAFSQWLGIERLEERPGYCKLRMKIRAEMLNGFQIAHGGISYSLADSALAFASNSHGRQAVSIETSISHLGPLRENDIITAIAEEEHCSNKVAIYKIGIFKDEKPVALFKGTVYRTSKDWEV